MEVVGVIAPRSQLVDAGRQPVGGQPFRLAGRIPGQLPQSLAVDADLVQAERPARRRPAAEHDPPAVKRQVVTVEDRVLPVRDQLGDAAVVQRQHAQVAARPARLHELGVVPPGAVRESFHEQQFAASQQGIVPHECLVLQRFQLGGQRGETWFGAGRLVDGALAEAVQTIQKRLGGILLWVLAAQVLDRQLQAVQLARQRCEFGGFGRQIQPSGIVVRAVTADQVVQLPAQDVAGRTGFGDRPRRQLPWQRFDQELDFAELKVVVMPARFVTVCDAQADVACRHGWPVDRRRLAGA